jgi:hypothetical protein
MLYSSYNRQSNFNNLDLVLPFINYWDYELTPYQQIPEYLYSSDITLDGLLFNFDFNSIETNVQMVDGVIQYIETPTYSSKLYTSGFTLNNIGLTSINVGNQTNGNVTIGEYTSTTFSFTGETLTIVSGDTNLKLWRIFPYGTTNYNFPLELSADSSGSFINFGGGYFNGFYKLFGYPYQLIQKRFDKGWTVQLNLNTHYNNVLFTGNTKSILNDTFTGNTGFFLYFGVRQENKFYDSFTGVNSLAFNTFLSGISPSIINAASEELTTTTGVSLDPYIETQENNRIENNMLIPGYTSCGCGTGCSNCDVYYNWDYTPIIWSGVTDNTLGFRVTPDFRLGYRRIVSNTFCILSATTTTNRCGEIIVTTGYTEFTEPMLVEDYSTIPMFTGFTCGDCDPNTLSTWINLTIKWERDFPYETDCELEYGKYKNGTLKTYVNGRPYWNVTGFTEFIPYELPTDPSKQEGVPFTISLAGGTSGLYQSQVSELIVSGGTQEFTPYDLFLGKYTGGTNEDLWIQNNFAGTFLGGISSFKMYEKPLNIGEIRHNYTIDMCRYNFKGNFGGRILNYPDYNCNSLEC